MHRVLRRITSVALLCSRFGTEFTWFYASKAVSIAPIHGPHMGSARAPRPLPRGEGEYRTMNADTARIEQLERRALLSSDMVIDWNDVAIDVLRADTTLPGPGWSSRALAIMHGAVFDAVNGIARTHKSIEFNASAPSGANMDAAIASAAHGVLTRLYSAQRNMLDGELQQSLAQVPNGAAEAKGVAFGRRAADKWLHARRQDHAGQEVPYTVSAAPGHWQ